VAYFLDSGAAASSDEECARNVAALYGDEAEFTRLICAERAEPSEGARGFRPIGSYSMSVGGGKLHQPPFLEMLDYCYERDFTHIHCETPGLLGLAALAIARNLGLPITGSWRDPRESADTRPSTDETVGGMLDRYLLWYYGQAERVSVATAREAVELQQRGFLSDQVFLVEKAEDALISA
jgi:hypothetical protein